MNKTNVYSEIYDVSNLSSGNKQKVLDFIYNKYPKHFENHISSRYSQWRSAIVVFTDCNYILATVYPNVIELLWTKVWSLATNDKFISGKAILLEQNLAII